MYPIKDIIIKNGSNLSINKASIEDAASIVAFLNKVGGETDFLTFGLNEFPFSIEEEEEEMIRECLDSNTQLMLVGKVEGQIVSHLFLQRSDKLRIAHIGDIGVSVSKNFWGYSIAFHMILAAIEWAKDKNLNKLQLQVRSDNERAIHLYKKLGFNIEGKIINAMKVNNIYYDDYIMGLLL